MSVSNIIVNGKLHDLGGGLIVRRMLPQMKRRMVGPFIFFDHFGPVLINPEQNTDVRPHPHIGLSTLTYLFEGRMVHRDSIGSIATILPGGVNWMTAGKGIAHSERTHEDDRRKTRNLHGLQFWVALPDALEDCEPSFQHYDKSSVPCLEEKNYTLNLIAGQGFGLQSKVQTSSSLILAHVASHSKGSIALDFSNFEMAVYLVSGSLTCAGETLIQNQMFILPPASKTVIQFDEKADFILIGGDPFVTPRHIWWNLVSSSKEKIEHAKDLWRTAQFPKIPGETKFIPLPE